MTTRLKMQQVSLGFLTKKNEKERLRNYSENLRRKSENQEIPPLKKNIFNFKR